jgi:N4-gp56 family major capsid protein
MAFSQTVDVGYPNHPWAGVDTNQREWYDPFLRDIYYRQSVYNRFVTQQFALAGAGSPATTQMTVTSLLPPHPNFDPIALRQLWMPSSQINTFARTLTFERYGAKMAMDKYSDMITYWKQNERAGLRRIIDNGLGFMMTRIMDTLARNAFLEGALGGGYNLVGSGSGDFADLTASEVITTKLLDSIHLGMQFRDVPYASNISGVPGNLVCITTPGVFFDLQQEATETGNGNAFIDIKKYQQGQSIINKEVGTYHHVRFVVTPDAMLWNCGPVEHQALIKAAVTAGDGSPDPSTTSVDGVKKVGQITGSGTIKRYIQLDTGDAAHFSVNDMVSIHTDRTSDFGVTNGADFRDGTLHVRRVVAVDTENDRISLHQPIMIDFDTDLGSGVYGYVTKGQHVHTAIYIGGTDGVVQAIGQPPRIITPKPFDDFESMYRVSFDAFMKYQMFEPEVFEVWYGAGSWKVKGQLHEAG